MPSGSKRRKAAKKKKENQPNNNNDNNPNSSSVSPRSHGDDDVKHQDDVGEVSSPGSQDHHSNEQDEIEAGENTGKIEVVDEPHKEEEEESAIVIEREIKNEASRKSYDGGSSDSSSSSSSSSSSGSDDESYAIKNSEAVADITPVLDSVQVIDEVIYSPATEEAHDSVEEIIADVEALKEEVEVSTDSPANSYAPPHIVESVFNEEIEEKKVSCAVEAEVGIVEDSKDAVLTSVENIVSISETKESVAQETDDRLSLACDAPIATADNGVDIEEISGVTEPLLAPAPHPVEKTSWKCCCGLFDVFTGSGR